MPKLNTLIFAAVMVASSGVHLALAQTSGVARLAVQSGNGQVACICITATLQALQPISVKATDVNLNPVAGATVNWTVTSGQVTLGSSTSITDGTGVATQSLTLVIFNNFSSSSVPFLVSTIQATSNNKSVVFTETQSLIDQSSAGSVISAAPPTFGGTNLSVATLSAKVGTTLSTPILVDVGGLGVASNGVANVSVRILNEQTSPTLTCANEGAYADPGTVLTNSQGIATCYPVFAGSGPGSFYILIGGMPGTDISTALYLQAYPAYVAGTSAAYNFTSIPGTATALEIVSGNNQVANIGLQLNPLVAKLVDASGNPVQGQTMVWSVVPAGAVALGLGPFVTDNNGLVSATVALDGLASSGAAITVAMQSNSNISATFQESVQGSLSAMNKVSGDSQIAQVGTTFANPLVVQVVNGSSPVVNYPVQYLVSGPVSLVGGTTVATSSSGRASVNVTAGTIAGTGTVTAVAGALHQSFTLTVTTASTAPPPNGIAIVSGNSQTAIVGATFAQPLVVQVSSTAGPVSGYTVNFSTTGPIALSTGSATTEQQRTGFHYHLGRRGVGNRHRHRCRQRILGDLQPDRHAPRPPDQRQQLSQRRQPAGGRAFPLQPGHSQCRRTHSRRRNSRLDPRPYRLPLPQIRSQSERHVRWHCSAHRQCSHGRYLPRGHPAGAVRSNARCQCAGGRQREWRWDREHQHPDRRRQPGYLPAGDV